MRFTRLIVLANSTSSPTHHRLRFKPWRSQYCYSAMHYANLKGITNPQARSLRQRPRPKERHNRRLSIAGVRLIIFSIPRNMGPYHFHHSILSRVGNSFFLYLRVSRFWIVRAMLWFQKTAWSGCCGGRRHQGTEEVSRAQKFVPYNIKQVYLTSSLLTWLCLSLESSGDHSIGQHSIST